MPTSRGYCCLGPAGFRALGLFGLLSVAGLLCVPAEGAVATGPLRVLPSNPRYFTDGSGKAVYLTGSHNWANLQDSGPTNPPPVFNYTAYLDLLQTRNHNFMRMWGIEEARWGPALAGDYYYTPHPFARTGPGTALDGAPKFDLNQFNQAYFDRLRGRVIAARDRGIYVSIMLFDGWSNEILQGWPGNPWPGHPFNVNNNINGVNGDPGGNNEGEEIHQLLVPAVTDRQKAYIRKVVDTVNDLDNVLYEIGNEHRDYSTAWQYELINYIKTYEAGKPKQHPVGMTAIFSENWVPNNQALFNSPADWISPAKSSAGGAYDTDPLAATGAKVILADTDHIGPPANPKSTWPWKCLLRGMQPILMDWWPNNPELDQPYVWYTVAEQDQLRNNMGYTLTYANKMNLAAMTPQNALASTGYCLAAAGSEYLVYQPGSGAFTVNLAAGSYSFEWFNPATAAVAGTGTIAAGGGNQSFAPSFSGDAVLYLKIASGPPSIITQPASQTVVEGQTATFSVAAGGTPPFSYQWQKNGADIAGATGASYTTPATTLADSGATFRCVVTNAYGSATSNSATLTVVSAGSGLVAHLKLDETSGTSAADASGYGNTATLNNGPVWTAGKVGGALGLDGANDYVLAPSSASFNSLKGQMTVAAWVFKKAADLPNYGMIVSRRQGPGWGDLWLLYYNNSAGDEYAFHVSATGGGAGVFGPASSGDVNTWVHLAGVYDGSQVRLYRNGVQVGSAPCTGTIPDETSGVILGAGDNGTNGISEFVNGTLDDVRVYNRALSATEIAALATVNQTLTAIIVSPSSANVPANGMQQFSATGMDQFGNAMATQPAFSWMTSGGGTINASGLFAAGATAGGPFTVTASSGGLSGTASVTVTSSDGSNLGFEAPSVATYQYNPVGAAWTFAGESGISANGSAFTSGNPNAPEGVQVSFLQRGSSSFSLPIAGFQASTSYTVVFAAAQRGNWNQGGGGQDFKVLLDSTVLGTFKPSGLAYADLSTAAVTPGAGTHTLQFVGLNTAGGDNTAFIDNVRIINQTFTTITVAPSSSSVAVNGTQRFGATAKDQFGNPISPQPAFTWAVSGGGTIDGAGLFTAGAAVGGPFTVTAASGTVSGTSSVTVTAPVAPAISTHPANQTVTAGQTATFSVVATGTAPLAYQWQKNGANIAGATGVSYTTPATTAADSGATFRVIVSNSAGTVTSNSATLIVTNIDPALRGWWTLDEGTGMTATDSSGNGNDGTLVNGPLWAAGKIGGGLSLDGANDYVSCGVNGMPAANASQTLAWWHLVASNPAGVQAVMTLTNGSNSAVQPGYRSGQVGVWSYGGTFLVSAAPPSANAWHHYAYTYDGTTHRLFLDGVQVNSSTVAPQGGVPTKLELGRWVGGTEYFNGTLDDVRVYNRALSAAEIAALANPTPNQPPAIESAPWADPNPVAWPNITTVNVVASDPDNGPSALSYTWSKVSGSGTVTFAPNGTAAGDVSTASFSLAGSYVLRVTVSDGAASVTGDVTVTVTDGTPPSVDVTTATLKGTADGTGSALASVTVNGQAATVTGNAWSHDVTVNPGTNVFAIVATDEGGNQTSKTVSISK